MVVLCKRQRPLTPPACLLQGDGQMMTPGTGVTPGFGAPTPGAYGATPGMYVATPGAYDSECGVLESMCIFVCAR